jgi:hypothetical protein
VKASVKHNENDATDAAAICEAVTLILIGFLLPKRELELTPSGARLESRTPAAGGSLECGCRSYAVSLDMDTF